MSLDKENKLSPVDEDHSTTNSDEAMHEEGADEDGLGVSQAVITIAMFVAFLSFVVVCLPLYFFN